MLKTLRSSLGTGGTLDKATGQMDLQGDHRDRLVADLIAKGYKAKAAGG
jgi:translation initiation factor 1 (eIF-1/SUI1)